MADKHNNRKVTLQGRVIIQGDVVAVTGLHIKPARIPRAGICCGCLTSRGHRWGG